MSEFDGSTVGKIIFGVVVLMVTGLTVMTCCGIIYLYNVAWLSLDGMTADSGEETTADATRRPDDAPTPEPFGGSKPKKGAQAIDFTLEDLEGNTVTLSDYEGRPIVLNFWATWCPPCVAEMPALDEASGSSTYEDVVILAVNLEESSRTVRQFTRENELSLTVLLDTDGYAAKLYNVRGIPVTYFIGRDGEIVDIHSGSLTRRGLENRIKELLEENDE